MNNLLHNRLFIYRLIAKSIDFGLVLFCHHFFNDFFITAMVILYLLASDGFWIGQSLGKRILGLKVQYLDPVTNESKVCPFTQSAIRNSPFALAMFLALAPLIGVLFALIGLLFVAIEIYFIYSDEEGIRIGDIYAKTRVLFSENQ